MDPWIKDTLKEVREDVKSIQKSVSTLEVLAARHNTTLEEHQRRSLANEEAVHKLRTELQPLKTHIAVFGALAKILTAGVALLGLVTGAVKLAQSVLH